MGVRPPAVGATLNGDGFWAGRRVFVTGHTGFKGSWLSLWLQRLGAELTGYALAPPSRPSLFDSAGVAAGMRSLEGDVTDLPKLSRSVREASPEVVVHMAAQSLVRRSYAEPVGTYATNVMGTVNVLEAVRRSEGVRVVIVVTTDKCYENREWPWPYREVDRLGGYDPYSSSKACAELVVGAYRDAFFGEGRKGASAPAVASARAGNVIGGGDWAADRLVPDLVRGFIEGTPARVRSPDAVRPWQHVLEPLGGYLLLARKLYEDGSAFAEAWNFAPRQEDARPVSWVADRLASGWGVGAGWTRDEGAHPHEARYLKLDWSKARERLAWEPRWTLENAIERVVGWYRSFAEDPTEARVRDVTLSDIDAFEARRRQSASVLEEES